MGPRDEEGLLAVDGTYIAGDFVYSDDGHRYAHAGGERKRPRLPSQGPKPPSEAPPPHVRHGVPTPPPAQQRSGLASSASVEEVRRTPPEYWLKHGTRNRGGAKKRNERRVEQDAAQDLMHATRRGDRDAVIAAAEAMVAAGKSKGKSK